MIHKILVLLLIFISSQSFASNETDYWIISQNDYNILVSKGRDVILRRYIVVPDIDKKYKNIFETKDEKELLAKFSFMLKKSKMHKMDNYIKWCDNSLNINNLIKGLYCFFEKQYVQAMAHFEMLENEDFKFLKLLMIADCKYELIVDKKNFKAIIEAYQIALDSTDSEQSKSIVNNRIKYVRYR